MVPNNNVTDNIGALVFGNNIDKSIVKIQGVTHTANNTGDITFHTSTTGTMSEKALIRSDGKVTIGTVTPSSNAAAYMLTVADPTNSIGNCGITIRAGTGGGSNTNQGSIFYSNATSGGGEYAGYLQYNHNTDAMKFGTGSVERMVIDSSGNVTKPTSFHILVRRSGNQTGYSATFPGDNILWNDVVTAQSSTNASNHFNTSTGIFTVPVTGLYFFHAAVNCNFNVQGAWLVVNGSRANYSAFNPNSANTSDGTITYKLTSGDEVALKWYENGGSNRTINANDLHTWWRIILLG